MNNRLQTQPNLQLEMQLTLRKWNKPKFQVKIDDEILGKYFAQMAKRNYSPYHHMENF